MGLIIYRVEGIQLLEFPIDLSPQALEKKDWDQRPPILLQRGGERERFLRSSTELKRVRSRDFGGRGRLMRWWYSMQTTTLIRGRALARGKPSEKEGFIRMNGSAQMTKELEDR